MKSQALLQCSGNDCCRQAEQVGSRDYEGLDPAQLASLRAPHQYAGLQDRTSRDGSRSPPADAHRHSDGFDRHGYLRVIADPDHANHSQVCCKHQQEFPLLGGLLMCV